MQIPTRPFAVAFLLAVTIGAPWATAEAQAASDLHGGWIISGWEAPEGHTGPTPRRGLFIFAASGHYSMMFVIGEPREALSEDPTDAEVAAAYGPFVANSGRYTVSGNQITYEAFVAKDPAYMSRFAPAGGQGNAQTMTFSIDDGTLTLGFGDVGPMAGARATLRRPGTGN